jgi:ribosomal protein S18 acetylase RimI-like enzyme
MTDEAQGETKVRTRPARPEDYPFALALYLDGSRGHLERLGRWDEERVTARFEAGFNPEQGQVLSVEGEEIGWLQVSESAERFHIHQIHLHEAFRGRGIGTRLIVELLQRAARLGKPVALNVIIGNPARGLYERLGFKVTGGDDEIVSMLWESGATDNVATHSA